MCGRYTLAADQSELQQTFPGFAFPDELPRRFNIAPGTQVAVVPNNGERTLRLHRWGLVPFWAKDPKIGNRMINARSETLAEKPAFREAYRKRRCLVLADGFYEWRQDPGAKTRTPVYIRLKSERPFAFAGLWESWQPGGEEPLLTCTILTTEPNDMMAKIHHRMPVILPAGAYDRWLHPDPKRPAELADLLGPYPASEMAAHPVSRLVNNPKNDSPDCIRPDEGASS